MAGVACVAAPFNACGLNILDHRPFQRPTVRRGSPVNVETIVAAVEWWVGAKSQHLIKPMYVLLCMNQEMHHHAF